MNNIFFTIFVLFAIHSENIIVCISLMHFFVNYTAGCFEIRVTVVFSHRLTAQHQHEQILLVHESAKLTTNNFKLDKFPLAPMGVLAPGSAHARPSAQPPIDTSGNVSAHVSAE